MNDGMYVRDISTLRISDAEEAGGKGANMGELVAAKLPVPPGFVLLRDCYRDSMRAGGVDGELRDVHREAIAEVADTVRLRERCERLQGLVHKAGIADSVRERLLAAYRALGPDAVVAVRSSATGEDGADASFAGMNATITNVSGEESLIDAVLRCWMSLFSPRVITYRASRDFTGEPAMAVVIQQMINSEKAGVAFTADPSNGAQDRVVIEGAFGLGEVVVSGEVEPDTYIVVQGNPRSARRPARAQGVQDRARPGRPRQGRRPRRPAGRCPGAGRHRAETHRRTRHLDRAPQRVPAGHRMGDIQRRDVSGAGQADHDVASHGGADFRQTRGVGPRTCRGAGNGAGKGARARNPRGRRRVTRG